MRVLSLNYLGNIQYFTKLCAGDCIIDIHENYLKQSYRNRCDIMTANGIDSLVIQTVKGSNFQKNSVAETCIDYSKRWQHQHWQAIVSAYRNSPYFDYYYPEFEAFYTNRYNSLVEFNGGLLLLVLKLLGSPIKPIYSDCYVNSNSVDEDWRDKISPKERLRIPDQSFDPKPYWQVFSDRYPFAENLSIVDLLFCEGPSSLSIINESSI